MLSFMSVYFAEVRDITATEQNGRPLGLSKENEPVAEVSFSGRSVWEEETGGAQHKWPLNIIKMLLR